MDKKSKRDSKRYSKKNQSYFRESLEESLDTIQSLSFVKPDITPLHVFQSGEYEQYYPIISTGNHYGFTSMSTYPIMNGKKIGNPICDCYQLILYNNLMIQVICDGCGVGVASRFAATTACSTAINIIDKEIHDCSNIKEIAEIMIRAAADAHENIFVQAEKEKKSGIVGATTMLIQVVVQLQSRELKFGIVTLNIGDCRSYLCTNQGMKTIYDFNSRESYRDISNSQGRIGNTNSDFADLENALICFNECSENDIIMVCSDGISDNFDPEIIQYENDKMEGNEKVKFMENLLSTYINRNVKLSECIENVCQYIVTLTKEARDMESNRKKKASTPKGTKSKPPGKVDHSTMGLLRIMLRNNEDPFYIDSYIPPYNHLISANQSSTETIVSRADGKIHREDNRKLFVVSKTVKKRSNSSKSNSDTPLSLPNEINHQQSVSENLSPNGLLSVSPLDSSSPSGYLGQSVVPDNCDNEGK